MYTSVAYFFVNTSSVFDIGNYTEKDFEEGRLPNWEYVEIPPEFEVKVMMAESFWWDKAVIMIIIIITIIAHVCTHLLPETVLQSVEHVYSCVSNQPNGKVVEKFSLD